MSTIGERIKLIRKEKKLTQVELGKLLGITGAGISYIESGGSQPTEAALKLICATYRVNYKWLTTGEGAMYQDLPNEERLQAFVEQYAPDASPYFKSVVLAAVKYLSDEDWARYRDFVEQLRRQADAEKATL
ncbi:MAG: helix-turn-helix transcriptional regulator [Oscillospiraceae bacterium]|nr:helix-turn-helix transcriptional regulator [Oscillospiraceae bacterium]